MTQPKTSDDKLVTLYLIEQDNFVNPRIYIEIVQNKLIKFAGITTEPNDKIIASDGKVYKGFTTTIYYKSTDQGTDDIMFKDFSHMIPELPHEIKIVFIGPGGDESTIVDTILPG